MLPAAPPRATGVPLPPAAAEDAARPLTAGKIAVLGVALVCMAVLWAAPLGWPARAQHALGLVGVIIALWLTEVVPHAVAGLIGCYVFWALGLVSFQTAFSGFASPTPWFLFAALLLGRMASGSGLARRLATAVVTPARGSYSRALLAFVILSFVISPVIPSGLARVAILAPIAAGLLATYGVARGGNTGRGLFMVLTYAGLLSDKMIISGAGTILARGLIEKLSGIRIYWSEWFLAFLPVSALTIVACWRVTLWLYPPERAQTEIVAPEGGPSAHPADRWTIEERKSALILTALIGLWSTDAFHHVSPEMVAIGVGLAAFLPGIKALTGEDLRRFNMTPVIFTGAALSLAGILTETGAIAPLATAMFAWMTPLVTRVPAAVTALYWSGIGYHLVMPNAQALLSTSMPALLQFGASHHLDPRALGMIWTFASGPSVMLYQSGIIILGYSYGYFDARDFLRYGLVLTAIECVLLVACASLYWPAIGLPLLR